MKKIYIIQTDTGTVLSKIIKIFTKDEYAHVSISLDKELKRMYSFGRLNPYNPFWGGFVHESIYAGTFNRFPKTKAKIYSIEITEEQYKIIAEEIEKIQELKEKYKFNILGLFAVGFKIKIRANQSFYCAEFVKHLLDKAEIENNLPELVRPENFGDVPNKKVEYKGLLRECV